MEDTQDAEVLIQAFMDAAEAQAELNRAREKWVGYSFEYAHSDMIERTQRKAQDAADRLASFIDERIARALDTKKL